MSAMRSNAMMSEFAIDAPIGKMDSDSVEKTVKIRMYSQGLGDCFLLTFPREEPNASADKEVHVLIDCGAVMGTPNDAVRMKAIVADIATTTGGHLDLLVITHEHWDHLSGFIKAADEWKDIAVDTLWTAWTEKPDRDGLPAVLKRILEKQRLTLTRIADHALRFGFDRQQATTIGLMSFLSDAPVDGQSFAAARSVADAFNAAKRHVTENNGTHVCCEPGEVRPISGTNVSCYVLGPPRSDAHLRRTGPTKDRETYEMQTMAAAAGDHSTADATQRARRQELAKFDGAYSLRAMEANRSTFNAFSMPLLGPSLLSVDGTHLPANGDAGDTLQAESDWESYEQSFPFDRSWRVSFSDAQRAASEHADAYPALASYCDDVYHWRRIDFDWLAETSEFALRADHLTNNTSLVLAFELPPGGDGKRKVLLFVGDAQVGNWLSWNDIPEWLPVDGAVAGQAKPDMTELLSRVVFYKVGHHGSHNATLKRLGLERMPAGPSLVMTAFVPVSTAVAHEIKNWDEMPLESLLDALAQRTGGRVVLPGGELWRAPADRLLEDVQGQMMLTVAPGDPLPPKVVERDGVEVEIEPAVPLWVEVNVPF